jgi:hypothetical protein
LITYGNHTLIFKNDFNASIKNVYFLSLLLFLEEEVEIRLDDDDDDDDATSSDPLRKSGLVQPHRTPTNTMDKKSFILA